MLLDVQDFVLALLVNNEWQCMHGDTEVRISTIVLAFRMFGVSGAIRVLCLQRGRQRQARAHHCCGESMGRTVFLLVLQAALQTCMDNRQRSTTTTFASSTQHQLLSTSFAWTYIGIIRC